MFFQIPLFAAVMSLSQGVQSAYCSVNCSNSLGMGNGKIKDKDLTASSYYLSELLPQYGRLSFEDKGGAWCPNNSDTRPWLQIELHQRHMVTGIATQGRFAKGLGQEYVETYILQYYDSLQNKWKFYTNATKSEYVEGNNDTKSIKRTTLDKPIMADKIRIFPIMRSTTICLRVELYGCLWTDGVVGVEVQGSHGKFPENDTAPLFDCIIPSSDADEEWMVLNDTTLQSEPFEITCEFDNIRAFQAVHLLVKQPFKSANITFSIDKEYYSKPLIWEPGEGTDLTYNLNDQIGRYVKMQFEAKGQSLTLGEIGFNSSIDYYSYHRCYRTTDGKISSDLRYIIVIIILVLLAVGFMIWAIAAHLMRKKRLISSYCSYRNVPRSEPFHPINADPGMVAANNEFVLSSMRRLEGQ
ncbi:discoidin domain-containing receptor 2-like [Euwallacea fornicatus]|uniref:discoidin domain-containing receptor 2-like n=1 Tax=Euwallacea fornicatus TaxID=995702 RepID=UPI00338F5897